MSRTHTKPLRPADTESSPCPGVPGEVQVGTPVGGPAGRPVLWAIAFVGLVYTATLFFLPANGMWTVDNSDKYLQVQALLSSGLRSSVLNWAGRSLVPESQCNPIPYPFGILVDGHLQSFYSPFFALVSTLPFKLWGFRGLVVWPLLATLVMLVGLARLAGFLCLRPRVQALAVLAAALATPTWFYSVVFWEHNLAACFLVWSLVAAVGYAHSGARRDLVRAAFLGAASVYFRDDLYLFLPLLMGAFLWLRRPPAREALRTSLLFAATATISLVPLWAINRYYTGHVLGLHLLSGFGEHLTEQFRVSGDSGGYLEGRPQLFHHLLTALHANLPLALVLAAPLVLLLVWLPKMKLSRLRWALPIAAAWAAVPLLVGLWELSQGQNPFLQLRSTNSLFHSAPIIVLGLMRADARSDGSNHIRVASILARVVLARALLYALVAPQSSDASGIHWGSRFLVDCYPILALLAVANIARCYQDSAARRGFGFLVVALVASLSLSAQMYSLNLASRIEHFFSRLNDSIEEMAPQAVLTDTWWVPLQLYRAFPTRPIFLVSEQSCWDKLEPRLREAGIHQILDVRWDRGGDTSPPGARNIVDDGLDFYGLTLQPKDLSTFRWRVRSVVPWGL